MVCKQCLLKLLGPKGVNHCPFCKNPVRSIRIDGRNKLPANIKALLFGDPMEMFKQGADMWEFQKGHVDMFFRIMEKEFRRMREEGQAELTAKREKNMQLEAAIYAGQQRNHDLKEKIKVFAIANIRSVAYMTLGTVKSPEVRRRQRKPVKSPDYEFFKKHNTIPSCSDMDIFEKAAGAFKTSRFK